MAKKLMIAIMVLCLFSGWGWSQERGQASGRTQLTRPQQSSTTWKRPMFLSGEVVLDDGQITGVPGVQGVMT
jgi:hypothetical protein